MERRFVVFLVLTLLMWTSFLVLRSYLAPEPPVAKQKQKGKPADDKQAADKLAEEKEGPAQAKRIEDQAKKDAPVELEPPAQPELAAAPVVNAPRKHITIGSLDPASGYTALYYFDCRGAALECAELNGDNYKSVEDHSGYVGRLDPTLAGNGGAEVQVVGPGTPAALAKTADGSAGGLAVGDVIKNVDGVAVGSPVAFTNYLRDRTRPGQTIVLSVVRGGAPLELRARLVRRPLEVVQPESHVFQTPTGVKHLPQDPLSLLLSLDKLGQRRLTDDQDEFANLPSLHDSNWVVEGQSDDFVEFSFTFDDAMLKAAKIDNAGPLKIVKRYSAAKAQKPGEAAYHLNLQIAIHNQGTEPLPVAYRLLGPTGLPLEGWWFSTKLHPDWAGAGARDVVWEQPGMGHRLLGCPAIVSDATKAAKKGEPQRSQELLAGDQASPLIYAGVDTQFFASVIQPQEIEKDRPIRFRAAYALPVQDATLIPKSRIKTANVSVRLITSEATIDPGQALTHDYRVFVGPKAPAVLAVYHLDRLIEFGWPIFGIPAKLLLQVLHGLYWLTGLIAIPNYGIAIILLTVIVRTCMIPVSLKQAGSAAKMQELAPEVQKIKDKFPDDPMKQHQAVQDLYKKHDFNMFGGCLPVFIQLPIFIGLYRCLSVDINLRDAALIPGISWSSNLAGPDKLFRWDHWSWMPSLIADEADGWLGPFFNVFPLITVALFLVQQKMFTPPATDEQTKMQQQMMTYMTVFMGVMFYKVPAGLCIYFITSSLWGIAERKLLPKPAPKESGAAGGSGTVAKLPPKPASPNGSAKSTSSKRSKQKR